jgi:N-methylhydantoinase A
MEAVYRTLQADAAAYLTAEGVPAARQTFQRQADLRYAKQGFEVTVDFPDADVSILSVQQLIDTFHRRHEQLYTYAAPDTPVEIVNLRLRAVGHMDKLTLRRLDAVAQGTTPHPMQSRPVYFADSDFVDTPVFARHTLAAGHVISGPAIVEQLDTTTVIYPGQQTTVDVYGNLHLRWSRR